MPKCEHCENQTTPFCGYCKANLQANSLLGLKEYLEKRLGIAKETLADWKTESGNPEGDEKKVQQGLARNTKTVEQLESWIANLTAKIEPQG